MQQQTLEQSILEFENWQADIGAKRMRIAALLRYGMAKSAGSFGVNETPRQSGYQARFAILTAEEVTV